MGKHKMVCHRRTGKYIARLALALGVLQLVAVLGSWIFKAVNPELPIRSLLSAEGIRWMVGNFGDNLAGRGLVWLLLGSMAYGSVRFCGILDVPRKRKAMSFWDHFGLMVARRGVRLSRCGHCLHPSAMAYLYFGHRTVRFFAVCFRAFVMKG